MTAIDDSTPQDPADIEREIRRTQEDMSRTVDQIGDQLTPRKLFNALLDKAEANEIDARYLLDGARRNPIALAMIAGGAIWLISDRDAKLPSRKSGARDSADDGFDGDRHHRDYLAHMDRVEWRDGEDSASYQRRRDMARASYLMVERNHDEDDQGFRQRLDAAAEQFRQKRQAWGDQARTKGAMVKDKGRDTAERARGLYQENPLIGGLLAAAAGAIAGTSLPMSRIEDEQLSGVGESARSMVGAQTDRLAGRAREVKDELVERASAHAAGNGSGQPDGGEAGWAR